MKADVKYSKEHIEFLHTLVYTDHNNHLRTTLYKKPTDRQNYLHAKSPHYHSLKNSNPYSQALGINRVCLTFHEYKKHSNDLVKRFMEKWCKENITRKPNREIRQSTEIRILFSVTYCPTLPIIKEIIN